MDISDDFRDLNFQVGVIAHYVYDFIHMSFTHMENSIREISGISAQEFTKKPIQETLGELIEISHLHAINEMVSKSIQQKYLSIEENELITVNLSYNILTRKQENKRLLVQFFVSEQENGIPTKSKGRISDISHIQKDGLPHMFIVKDNKVIFEERANPDMIIKNTSIPLSRTEINILRHTAKGMTPKEISEILHISISTLYTHRKNIRNKMEMDINAVISLLRDKEFLS